jgi:hypothetical protein
MADYFLLGSIGAIAGLLAGLFGIGGGIIIVPALIFSFEMDGMGQYATKLAIGTSLAAILFMGLASSFTHYKKKALEWESLYSFAPFIILGTFIGSQIAGNLDGLLLKKCFAILVFCIAVTMFFRVSERKYPLEIGAWKWPIYSIGGLFIGTISSLFGTGGGTMTVPLLVLLLDKPIRMAVGTASATGVIIGLFGTIGFIYQGWQFLPDMRFGFVAPKTALLIAVFGCMTAPLGALIAHRIDTLLLSRVFAIFLIIISLFLFL